MTTDNHTEIQLEFTRKCLRFFYDDIPQDEYDGSEDDLREYAATINEGHGYNLDTQIAALTAERDRLRAALKPFAEAATLVFIEPKIRTLPVEAEYLVAARRALNPQGEQGQ